MKKIKIARIVTIAEAFVHILPFIKLLKEKNISLDLIASRTKYTETLKSETGIDLSELTIQREIAPFQDLVSLIKLALKFLIAGYDVVHSSTPKAGLLTAIAGFITFRKVRIHTFTGQRWATLSGFKRKLLMKLDRLIIILSTQCYADSPSQIDFLIASGVAKEGEVKCINLGSYGGIDINRFNREKFQSAHLELTEKLTISSDSIIILFVGRVTREKGIVELVEAFKLAKRNEQKLQLVIVGPFESRLDVLPEEILFEIKENPSIHHLGFQTNPEFYFAGADIFCLPSYREGFGTVVLEAASSGLCAIGTKIPGLVDSIVDGVTGVLVQKHDVSELSAAILTLSKDKELRSKLSLQAMLRARTEFNSNLLAELQWLEYERLLKK